MYYRVANSYIGIEEGDSMFKKLGHQIMANAGAKSPADFARIARQQAEGGQSTTSKMFLGSKSGSADHSERLLEAFTEGSTMDALGAAAAGIGRNLTAKDMAGEGWARAGAVAARNGIPLAAYGAVAGGTRYMSGGSMGTNNQGQRDIAGIPFL